MPCRPVPGQSAKSRPSRARERRGFFVSSWSGLRGDRFEIADTVIGWEMEPPAAARVSRNLVAGKQKAVAILQLLTASCPALSADCLLLLRLFLLRLLPWWVHRLDQRLTLAVVEPDNA